MGTDVLNASFAKAPSLANTSVKNIENINFTAGTTFSADISANWEGVQNVTVTQVDASKNVTLTSKAGNVSVNGGTTVIVADTNTTAANAGSNLKTVSIDGAVGALTVTGKAIHDVTVSNHAGTNVGLTVNNDTAAHALNLTVNNIHGAATAFTVTDTKAGVVSINAVGKESVLGVTTFAKATALHINADADLTITKVTNAATADATLKTIDIKGDSVVTLGAMDTVSALTDISADKMTTGGSVDLTYGTSYLGANFTGSMGNDVVNVGSGAVTGKLDAGAGSGDVLAFAGSGHYAAIVAKAQNFEVLRVSGTTAAYDTTAFKGLQAVEIGNNTGNISIANLTAAQAQAIRFYGETGAAKNLTLGLKDSTGANDSVTVELKALAKDTAVVLGTSSGDGLVLTAIESLNIKSNNALTGDKANTLFVDSTGNTTLKDITITGDSSLDLSVGKANVNIDASSFGKDLKASFAVATAPTTIKGGAGNDTFKTKDINEKLTLLGGGGNDTLVLDKDALTLGDPALQHIKGISTLQWGVSGAPKGGTSVMNITPGGNLDATGINKMDLFLSAGGAGSGHTFSTNDTYAGIVNLDLTVASTAASIGINTGAGSDTITLVGTGITSGNTTINAHDGDNKISVAEAAATAGTISVTTGAGNDVINITTAKMTTGSLIINAGDGNNDITFAGGTGAMSGTTNGITVTSGAGDDKISVTADKLTTAPITVNAGDGSNVVTINAATATSGAISYTGGAGADNVTVSAASQTTGKLTIDTGEGNDVITAVMGTAHTTTNNAINITGGKGADSITLWGEAVGTGMSAGSGDVDANAVTIHVAAGDSTLAGYDVVHNFVPTTTATSNLGMTLDLAGTPTVKGNGVLGAFATVTDGKVVFLTGAPADLTGKLKYIDDNITTLGESVSYCDAVDTYVFSNDDVHGSTVVELAGVTANTNLITTNNAAGIFIA